VSEGVRR